MKKSGKRRTQSVFLKRFSEGFSRSILQNIVLRLWSKSVKNMREGNHYFSRLSGWKHATLLI